MAHPFLKNLELLADLHLSDRSNIECKHFFSGAALYSNGDICASLTPVGLAFKLSAIRCSELIDSGAAYPLKYFQKSPIKKDYALFPDFEGLDDDTIAMFFGEAVAQTK